MAPTSPRRSSRARATNSQSHQSSGSSSLSGRAERSTRSVNKPSSTKSTPSASSLEPLDDLDDTLLGRRRKRGQDDEVDRASKIDVYDMANASDDLQEEDEAVRCICGAEEYPGRPPVDGPDADFFSAIELTEDVTGFFVQCDVCKVWQHGACVGIFSAESSPEEYFCEQCRKDLHKIHTAGNGQKYSKYVPLHRPSRSTSRAASIVKEGARSPKTGSSKNGRTNSASQTSKRRSTMNSRDRAYEDEQLLRAIEASKEDAPHDAPENGARRTKRGRSDSDDSIAVVSRPQSEKHMASLGTVHVKRQRTNSQSPSPPPVQLPHVSSRDDLDYEANTRTGSKKARNGKSQREKTEKEDKERKRQEAANKRKGRAERRRGDDSPPSEATNGIAKPGGVKSLEPGTPLDSPKLKPIILGTPSATRAPASKRGGRGHHKKGKGRNQYTRDRDGDNGRSPARSTSRDIHKNGDDTNGHRHGSKSKSGTQKLSMIDMKRRVGAILDFISRTQVDLATEAVPVPTLSSGQSSPQKTPVPQVNGHVGKESTQTQEKSAVSEPPPPKDFKDLNCVEMMDVLTRDMVKWQNQYA